MSVCFETHGHEDKFWNLGPMPTVDCKCQENNAISKKKTHEDLTLFAKSNILVEFSD